MRIEGLEEEDCGDAGKEELGIYGSTIDVKRVVVLVGARALFYPTLLYNVARNKMQAEFRWWDEVDEFLLLGAVPFPSDVPHLKQLGVHGVITLNESYETLVPTSLYLEHEIEHLVIPTRDYYFAPSFGDICQAVNFIHKNASCGKTTYVHCKAGRGRSTTIVLCYLVQYKLMTPKAAFEHVRTSRPRIRLAASQWQAVNDYYRLQVKKTGKSNSLDYPIVNSPSWFTTPNLMAFDESSFIMVSESDLEGYDVYSSSSNVGNSIYAELSVVYRVQIAGKSALAKLSCFWLRFHAHQDALSPDKKKLGRESCSLEADELGSGHPCLVTGLVLKL
ncbi:Phosphatidylglycerophosphatase protein [Dioscorea alata]|uniref:Phosphatidylglycerophosphatase protein n=1 Tax=Dioscorea alata TaxID=55571 RepID=A0ACB7UGC1_DIOAL|nr:Phosphatidylglycerophosphatase protein [Dioscorea alata]